MLVISLMESNSSASSASVRVHRMADTGRGQGGWWNVAGGGGERARQYDRATSAESEISPQQPAAVLNILRGTSRRRCSG